MNILQAALPTPSLRAEPLYGPRLFILQQCLAYYKHARNVCGVKVWLVCGVSDGGGSGDTEGEEAREYAGRITGHVQMVSLTCGL